MNKRTMRCYLAGALLAAAATAVSVPVLAQDDSGDVYDNGYGYGMMGGYGPGWGMGPGMMGGYGPGPGYGMMGGYGPGPGYGMMGGYGPGPGYGMMGGYGRGMGPGMMWGYGAQGPFAALNLSAQQREKINSILDSERKQHWTVMGKMLGEQSKLRDLYAQEEPDPKKVGAVYGELAKLRQQMIETHVQAHNQILNVLTKEQREQLQQWRRGWGPGWGPRSGGPASGPGPGAPGR